MTYTRNEKVDMLLILGECHNDEEEASRVYALRYPDRRHPVPVTFRRTEQNVRNGIIDRKPYVRRRVATSEANVVFVLGAVVVDPHVSTRDIAAVAGISQSSVRRILHKHAFHPYHISLAQELHGPDFNRRLQFCEWIQTPGIEDLLPFILFSDEATFTNRGEVNRHNMHYWAAENPHWVRHVNYQQRWSVNVWCGILGNYMIGPYFLDGNLTGRSYALFLRRHLPRLLEEVDLHTRQTMWFQQDGHPAHSSNVAVRVLNRTFPNKWIGRRGPHAWPPRSPDLTPLDYFLWGYVKQRVYATEPTTPNDMKHRIREACQSISVHQLILVRRSFWKRIRECVNQNGGTFEHILGD